MEKKEVIYSKPSLMKILPSVIYKLIQNYLDNLSYNSLMNTNRMIFQEIKSETVRYYITIDEARDSHMIPLIERVVTKVKYPTKQITLTITNATRFTLKSTSFYPIFHQVHHHYITLHSQVVLIDQEIDFTIFNDISKVTLSRFRGIQHIKQGLENIQELILMKFPDLISIDCPLIHFDLIYIASCSLLSRLPIILKTKKVEIRETGIKQFDFSTLDTLKSFQFQTCFPETCQLLSNIHGLDYSSLECFAGFGLSFKKKTDFSILSKIPIVALHNLSDDEYYPKFPIFHGKNLMLQLFDLSLWSNPGIIMENLLVLNLRFCRNFLNLPIFPQVRDASLHGINEFFEIPSFSFPNCRFLHIFECTNLIQIHRLPKLKSLEIRYCDCFEKFIGFIKNNTERDEDDDIIINRAIINKCRKFNDIASLRNVRDLELVETRGLRSFSGFDLSRLHKAHRKVKITNVNAANWVVDGLGNIGKLTLNRVYNLDRTCLSNIDELIEETLGGITDESYGDSDDMDDG